MPVHEITNILIRLIINVQRNHKIEIDGIVICYNFVNHNVKMQNIMPTFQSQITRIVIPLMWHYCTNICTYLRFMYINKRIFHKRMRSIILKRIFPNLIDKCIIEICYHTYCVHPKLFHSELCIQHENVWRVDWFSWQLESDITKISFGYFCVQIKHVWAMYIRLSNNIEKKIKLTDCSVFQRHEQIISFSMVVMLNFRNVFLLRNHHQTPIKRNEN